MTTTEVPFLVSGEKQLNISLIVAPHGLRGLVLTDEENSSLTL